MVLVAYFHEEMPVFQHLAMPDRDTVMRHDETRKLETELT